MLTPVILAGGSGTRLWPLSRQQKPKQFLNLLSSEATMLQSTFNRLSDLDAAPAILLCNEEHRFLVAEQLRQIGENSTNIILEPSAHNTAPAITLAALHAQTLNDDPILLVLSADHEIQNKQKFTETILKGYSLASQGNLVVFGIQPTHPETGYGYIQQGEPVSEGFKVNSFKEKPDIGLAQQYLESKEYYWNSGIFMFKASIFLDELMQHSPTIAEQCQKAYTTNTKDLDFIRISEEVFSDCPSESIDYALMEKTDRSAMVLMEASWNDVGSWDNLWKSKDKDTAGNVVTGDVITEETYNSFIRAENRLVAAVGLEDTIIIETTDSILVSNKDHATGVKKVVEQLQKSGRQEHIQHPIVHRPWGFYYSIYKQERYQVKHITVNPKCKLSTQMHHHRAEHWIVVKGMAQVTKGEETFLLSENESTFIPVGIIHALENPGIIPLELIEVQSGAYLGEDDIVRICDQYGRV